MFKHSMDLLLEACGAAGPVEVVVTGPGKSHVQVRNLFLPLALVGREEQADLSLPDPSISRRHAYVQMISGQFFAVDLLSRTGTRWQGSNAGMGWIQGERLLEVGPYTLRFMRDAGEKPELPNPLETASLCGNTEPELALECVQGTGAPYLWRMQTVLALVGRRAVALGLGIQDRDVSGFHCSLLRTPKGVWLIDLLGQGGTLLNGRRIRWGQLEDRDLLQLGQHRFRVVLSAPSGGRRETSARSMESHLSNGMHDDAAHPANVGTLVALAPSAKPALTQDFLVSLFDQFATVQNQMFDQFQQAMTMMVDMFSEMQREQVGLIQKEVDRLHQITDEIHALQNQLVNGREPTAPLPIGDAASNHRPPQRVNEPESGSLIPDAAATAPSLEGAPVVEKSKPPLAHASQGQAADGEVHVWLYDKIAELQRERHGRVKRIFDFLRGK